MSISSPRRAAQSAAAGAYLAADLHKQYQEVRAATQRLVQPLQVEDFGIQPMADASPPKWHLAHTSWFFETFLLQEYLPGYSPFAAHFDYLFNSYYNGVGAQFPRTQRGNLSRPSVDEVQAYRDHVDGQMQLLLQRLPKLDETDDDYLAIAQRLVLGLHHEQQHQELLLTDLKYNFGHNPLYPQYLAPALQHRQQAASVPALEFVGYEGGIATVGTDSQSASADFCFDNETPRHQVLLQDFGLANRLVTNGEYLAFMEAGGYGRSDLWLANAWTRINDDGWRAPLYWREQSGQWYEYQLDGLAPIDLAAPVCHLSYYEATAYAAFVGARLPTEFEWEHAAQHQQVQGNFVEHGLLKPQAAELTSARVPGRSQPPALAQLYGDLWEWTCSSYGAYPGYQPLPGTLGEYNGKFMSEQLVLRGGSCYSSQSYLRASYRNFFYPADRWQMTGLRLARQL